MKKLHTVLEDLGGVAIALKITGVYVKTVYRNEVDGFTIFKLKLNKPMIDNPLTEISCKGTMPSVLICTPLILEGDMVYDDYGSTFIVRTAEPFSDSEAVTIEYLSSNLFNGIAVATATKIVELTGSDIFSYVQSDGARENLLKIKGLTEEKVDILIRSVCHTKTQKEIFSFISSFGGNVTHAEKLFEEFGPKAISNMKIRPYETGNAADLPFRVCDCIAKTNGIQYDNLIRVKSIILNVLKQCYNSGDMYVLLERIFRGVDYTEKNASAFPDDKISCGLVVAALGNMKEVVSEVIPDKQLQEDCEIRYYLKKPFFEEVAIAENIKRLQVGSCKLDIDADEAVKDAEKLLNIKYSQKQKECFSFLNSSGIKIITGGPGTGKSTVINGLIYEFQKNFPRKEITIMAPTGRAAQRIGEITSLPAGTIHRTLNILPYSKGLLDSAYNADFPADIIIVDEASMLDSSLMSLLMKSIKSSALVIFCGDVDQLPSVGAGNVLHDLISSNKIETVQLDTIYRQKDKSAIIKNAIKVNNGSHYFIQDPSFEIIECETEEEIRKTVVNEFINIYNTDFPYDVQVLSSTKKGAAGTYSLNKSIQNIINDRKTVTAHSNSKFRIKDKIMTTHNNYDIGYFNGDMGIIEDSDERFIYVKLFKDRVAIPKSNVQDMELAYACTVHKSQGSEYDTVIVSLPENPSIMLRRNLLYTAITRAKKRILIVTQKNCIDKSVDTVVDSNRKSALAEKIIKKIGA